MSLQVVCVDKLRLTKITKHDWWPQSVSTLRSWAEWIIWSRILAFKSMIFTHHCFQEPRDFTVTGSYTFRNSQLQYFTGTFTVQKWPRCRQRVSFVVRVTLPIIVEKRLIRFHLITSHGYVQTTGIQTCFWLPCPSWLPVTSLTDQWRYSFMHNGIYAAVPSRRHIQWLSYYITLSTNYSLIKKDQRNGLVRGAN